MASVANLPKGRVIGLMGRLKHRWMPTEQEVKGYHDPYLEVAPSGNIRLMKLPRKHEAKPFDRPRKSIVV